MLFAAEFGSKRFGIASRSDKWLAELREHVLVSGDGPTFVPGTDPDSHASVPVLVVLLGPGQSWKLLESFSRGG